MLPMIAAPMARAASSVAPKRPIIAVSAMFRIGWLACANMAGIPRTRMSRRWQRGADWDESDKVFQ
jgi:hypothetical protein